MLNTKLNAFLNTQLDENAIKEVLSRSNLCNIHTLTFVMSENVHIPICRTILLTQSQQTSRTICCVFVFNSVRYVVSGCIIQLVFD